jgi:hypothetical protein
MGWTVKNSGVVLNDELRNYLDIFSSQLPFDIVVTSGVRTPRKQIDAMYTKIELGDDILKLYKDKQFAQDVLDAYPDVQKGIKAVNDYIARGGGKTMHLSGRAVDIRTRDLTQNQIDTMIAVVNMMGDRPLYEDTPPHLDISLRKNYKPSGSSNGNGSGTQKKRIPLIVALLIGGILWMS